MEPTTKKMLTNYKQAMQGVSNLSEQQLKVLADMWNCSSCAPAGSFQPHSHKNYAPEDLYEWLYHNLPAAKYVADSTVNLIFSNNLTTGDEEQDKKLDAFLYAKNINGVANYDILKEGILNSMIYGKAGIRKLSKKDGIVMIKSKYYASVVEENKDYVGVKQTIGYVVSKKQNQKIKEIDLTKFQYDIDFFREYGVMFDPESNVYLLSPEDLLNLRNDIAEENGSSQFDFDKQRIEMLTKWIERLNYDIEYDGMGRVILHVADKGTYDEIEISTGEVISTTQQDRLTQKMRIMEEAAGVAEQLKNAGSEAVTVLSDAFDKDITQIPRVTKATELLNYLSNENIGDIVSQIFGVPSVLINLGRQNGNISMEAVIDNAMINEIVPKREKYAVQISGFLAEWIGVDKIYFDKYELTQAIDEHVKQKEVADIMKVLTDSGYEELASKFAIMLENDIVVNGEIVKMGKAAKAGDAVQVEKLVQQYIKDLDLPQKKKTGFFNRKRRKK